jgi:uncharacterized membrane protein YfcA
MTGLGFSTLCLGLLASFVDLRIAIPLVFLPSLTSNVLVMMDAGRFRESLRRFWPLFVSTIPGLAVGIWILGHSSSNLTRGILGVVLLMYGAWGLWRGLFIIPEQWRKLLIVPVGFFTGIINGATGSQIMPIMPYLLSLQIDRNLLVQTINTSFTFSTMIMILGLGKMGFITGPIVMTSLIGILPVALGIRLGGKIRKKVTEETYRRCVLMLLII